MKPLIYTIVPEETLKSMMESFHECIHLPIQIIDESGSVLADSGPTAGFCRCFQQFLPPPDSCEIMHATAGKRAIQLGEPYIFECNAQLNHIVFPLITKKTFLGSILVGPFLMEKPDAVLIMELSKNYHIPTKDALELYEKTNQIPVIAPNKVNHISRLLYYMFGRLIDSSIVELKQNNQKFLQQSLINESIQRYKLQDTDHHAYPYETEKELIHKVKMGNVDEAKAILNDLLGYVLLTEGSSLDIVKTRSLELTSLLSRTAIEGGAATDNILKLNNQFVKHIQQIDSLESLCFHLEEIIEAFTESMFNHIPSQNSELVKKAMIYMSKHFNEPLTLEDVATYVHLHPSYFSSVFKNSTGSSFKEYLNMVRIEEGKRLLMNTDFSILDIAIAIGFEDQSYFTRVFKKNTGITPKQYR